MLFGRDLLQILNETKQPFVRIHLPTLKNHCWWYIWYIVLKYTLFADCSIFLFPFLLHFIFLCFSLMSILWFAQFESLVSFKIEERNYLGLRGQTPNLSFSFLFSFIFQNSSKLEISTRNLWWILFFFFFKVVFRVCYSTFISRS